MRTKACLGTVIALLAIGSGRAVAAPVDATSDHVALRAFDRYLGGLLSDVPAGKQSADGFVSSISASCPNVLAPISVLPAGSISTSAKLAFVAFVEEAGLDLGIALDAPDRAPLAHLGQALSKLRWSSKATSGTVKRFLTAERGLFSLAPSDLCADAKAFATNPEATPPGTELQWLATAGRVVSDEHAAASQFLTVMGRLSGPADARVIHDIVGTDKRFRSAAHVAAQTDVPKLLTALGLRA